jgi:ataxia telangiectasia mutated family protein
LASIRSVAVTSIVGYILGIGDRHSYNILMDTQTAEVVHIDFGIVFDQGKGLGTPETVPFRLTRDIIDGMGICGVEGTYRKCCEEVLRVMRENSLAVLTILGVVIHDPLYKWSLSPADIRSKQNGNTRYSVHEEKLENTVVRGQFGRDAGERTLMRIKAKLQGFEDPTGDGLSVEGQVEYLINEAQSIDNLSRLFPGWAPWL